MFAAGCGLVAFGAVDRAPAPPTSASQPLLFIVVVASRPRDLLWWPLLLILLGGGALAAGLRPRAPLPPEPDPYRAGEQPLAARTDEEITLRVRDDSPPDSTGVAQRRRLGAHGAQQPVRAALAQHPEQHVLVADLLVAERGSPRAARARAPSSPPG